MRIVLDTKIVASGLLWTGPPRALLQAAREKRIRLFTSVPLLVTGDRGLLNLRQHGTVKTVTVAEANEAIRYRSGR